jgi:hypothetical protein
MSRVDQISAQLGIELNLSLDGTNPHRDFWRRFIKPTTFLGVNIPHSAGVHESMLPKLSTAESSIRAIPGNTSGAHGITNITGYQEGFHAFHSWGLAIDINYMTNPYIMHESGERSLDYQLAEVYHRIARFMLGRDSVIPRQIRLDRQPSGESGSSRTRNLYNSLAEESAAMQRYFTIMQNLGLIENQMRNQRNTQMAFGTSTTNNGSPQVLNPEEIQQQMMTDWSALTTRPLPHIQAPARPNDNSTRVVASRPVAAVSRGDRPFDVGRGTQNFLRNANRTPLNGFLDLRYEVVDALVRANLQWGAIHLGNESGDIMHFETPHNDPLGLRLLRLFRQFP